MPLARSRGRRGDARRARAQRGPRRALRRRVRVGGGGGKFVRRRPPRAPDRAPPAVLQLRPGPRPASVDARIGRVPVARRRGRGGRARARDGGFGGDRRGARRIRVVLRVPGGPLGGWGVRAHRRRGRRGAPRSDRVHGGSRVPDRRDRERASGRVPRDSRGGVEASEFPRRGVGAGGVGAGGAGAGAFLRGGRRRGRRGRRRGRGGVRGRSGVRPRGVARGGVDDRGGAAAPRAERIPRGGVPRVREGD